MAGLCNFYFFKGGGNIKLEEFTNFAIKSKIIVTLTACAPFCSL